MVGIKKILVAGAGGLLGSEFNDLRQNPPFPGIEIIPKTRQELDIANPAQVEDCLALIKPHFVVNCAGYTNVDRAESEPEEAYRINAEGPSLLAQACLKNNAKLIHYSTDFVFDGKKREPYLESDAPAPLSAYARSKWEGEKAVASILPSDRRLILRISWPYGKNGKNFIHSLWELSKTRKEIRVVNDQVGVPNPARLIAKKTLDLLAETSGLFHLSCKGACSRFELIRFLLSHLKSSCKVIPVRSDEFPSPAKRPAYSALSTERKGISNQLQLPFWQDALLEYLKE